MKTNQKMGLLLIIFNFSFLQANFFDKFSSLNWNWIGFIAIPLFFLIASTLILIKLYKSRKEKNVNLLDEITDDSSNKSNLNDIKTYKKEYNIIKFSNEKLDEKKITEALNKFYKDIFTTAEEEKIYLYISSNKDIGSIEIFKTEDLLNELEKIASLYNSVIEAPKENSLKITSNKELIESIVFLMIMHQIKEHSIKKPKISIKFDFEKNSFIITSPLELKLDKNIEKVLNTKLSDMHIEYKIYGVYLFLIYKLLSRINGNLYIVSKKNRYMLKVEIPVIFNQKSTLDNFHPQEILRESKKALIISQNINLANRLSLYLEKLNFSRIVIKLANDLNKEIPNFLDFDIIFIDAELFEPLLSGYIESIKKYSDLKIVALKENGKLYDYSKKIVDSSINIYFLDKELPELIKKIYPVKYIDEKENINVAKEENIQESPKNATVLVADDDRTNLHILEYLLKQYNLNVLTASNGEEVLKILEKNSCDLIILDSIMPKLDGFETIKYIRNNPKFNSTPVIIHTSFSLTKNKIEDIFKLGFDSYLPKPFNKYELKALLERYLLLDIDIPPKNENIIKSNKKEIEEFLAIYGDSDKLLEKYLKENRIEQAITLLNDLENFSNRLNFKKFTNYIENIKESINKNPDINIAYNFSIFLNNFKKEISSKL